MQQEKVEQRRLEREQWQVEAEVERLRGEIEEVERKWRELEEAELRRLAKGFLFTSYRWCTYGQLCNCAIKMFPQAFCLNLHLGTTLRMQSSSDHLA